jgi:hypothetical protein
MVALSYMWLVSHFLAPVKRQETDFSYFSRLRPLGRVDHGGLVERAFSSGVNEPPKQPPRLLQPLQVLRALILSQRSLRRYPGSVLRETEEPRGLEPPGLLGALAEDVFELPCTVPRGERISDTTYQLILSSTPVSCYASIPSYAPRGDRLPVAQGRACLSHGGLRRLSGACNWKKQLAGNAHGSPTTAAASVLATSPTYETVVQESMVLSLGATIRPCPTEGPTS